MDNIIIRTMVELEVNVELATEFHNHLENQLAGIYDPRDKREIEQMIDEVDHTYPGDWSAALKKELVLFVCCAARGSFHCGVGYMPTCYMKPIKNGQDGQVGLVGGKAGE